MQRLQQEAGYAAAVDDRLTVVAAPHSASSAPLPVALSPLSSPACGDSKMLSGKSTGQYNVLLHSLGQTHRHDGGLGGQRCRHGGTFSN
jgi:hypothetical protein